MRKNKKRVEEEESGRELVVQRRKMGGNPYGARIYDFV